MSSFDQLVEILKRLRHPEDGCPWDLKQTPESLLEDLIEETYECVDAVKNGDEENIREELGDLYLMITFISYIKEQEGSFTIEDVLKEINQKMIRRHPHIFSDAQAETADDVLEQWDEIKKKEKNREQEMTLDSVPQHYPPLLKSHKFQKKAAKLGFDWNKADEIIDKIEEELNEWKYAVKEETYERQFEEMGDLLFSVVNLARFSGIRADLALHHANIKFKKRFDFIENKMKNDSQLMNKKNIDLMEKYWQLAKSSEIFKKD